MEIHCELCGADLEDLDPTEICEDENGFECVDCEETAAILQFNEKIDDNPNFGKPFSKNPVHVYCGNGVTKHHENGKKWTTHQ